ncbi:hypothetical protein HYU95_01385 [Candidatus Daviesbacteria bacterium]|nr:hypothetical protein [Candidatus Daviesbacteria bacterium]
MLNENFVILGVAISLAGSLKYLIDTIAGKVKPNKVTFFLWALAPLIAFAAQIKQGIGIISLATAAAGFTSLAIFAASFVNKKAIWKLSLFDLICGGLSLIGLALWYITQVGNLAIVFAILADGLAALPTITKAYYYPQTENGWTYLAAAISALIALLTIKVWSFAYYGFPLYILIVCLLIFYLVRFKIGKIKST